MTTEGFGFFFEAAGLGPTEGAVSPAEQFFEGSHAEESLARETGQNSLDARAGAGPVTMVFELASMPTDMIPGIADLREHIDSAERETAGSQGHSRLQEAVETARADEIMVLRISDYGTRGLAGSETIADSKSPLSALTRGAGISSDDGFRGGSFGIGSAVGPAASGMRTVFYSSLPLGADEVVFAGSSRLATHPHGGISRVAHGYFTDLSSQGDFRYLRNPGPFGPFSARTEPGTDIYILAYRKAAADADLKHIRIAFLNNFLLAIHRGHLVVKGKAGGSAWVLDAESLPDHVGESAEATAFYRALLDPEPVVLESQRLGRVSLYINVDDSLEKALHTIAVRKPLMKIETFRFTSIPIKYAAILECSDDKGNTLLRELEPPQHHKWDPARGRDGKAAITELQKFAREALKSRVKEQIGEHVEIKGLAKYLPAPVDQALGADGSETGTPVLGEGTQAEAATIQGADAPARPAMPAARRSVRISVRRAASADGDQQVEKGKDQGGRGKRNSSGGSLPGTGGEGKGKSLIESGNVRFRSWTDSSSGELCLALTPDKDVSGDIELIALGPGGSVETGYTLPISTAYLVREHGPETVTHAGNILRNIDLAGGTTSLVKLTLTSERRYRLEVR